jgi:hypothetical protein
VAISYVVSGFSRTVRLTVPTPAFARSKQQEHRKF